MPSPAIAVKDLKKRYKKADKNSVDGISFEVQKGKFVAFLGPNGAGKTTTISILTTTLEKTSGSVSVAGYSVEKEEDQIRKNIGIIFQKPSLDENLTCEENIRIHAGLYNVATFRPLYSLMSEQYKNTVTDLMALVDLQKQLHKPVKSLSGGMKRKLEVIRSLIHKPTILFLDEPTTGLDPVSRRSIWQYLNTIRQEQGTTIFLTTHYLDEAEECDNILILKQGKIILEGRPGEIKEQLKEDYLILETGDHARLIRELGDRNISFLLEANNTFRIDILTPVEAQQIMHSITTPLTGFKMYQPTLEEAYINLIEQSY